MERDAKCRSRECADEAGSTPAIHRRTRPDGLAEGVRLQLACPRGGRRVAPARVIGNGLRSQTDGRQATEVAIAAEVLNRMLDLGRPDYVRIG
jgi:hypothetical protein